MDWELKCPKCNEPMEEGFMLNIADRQGKCVSSWIAGARERSICIGFKTNDRDNFPIRTFRCSGCGYLYANNSN
jgi:hypothetical protein